MPWNIRRDFHIDINAAYGSYLLVSATDSSLRQPPPDMVAGDGMPVRFHFWERGPGGTLTAADPGAGTVFVFSGRPAGAPSGSDLLFVTDDFTEIDTGVWEGTLDLTPAEFSAHLDDATNGAKLILGELEVRDSVSNTKRTSFQFDLTARRQVYNGDEPLIGLAGRPLSDVYPAAFVPDELVITGTGLAVGGDAVEIPKLIQTMSYNGRPAYTDNGMPISEEFEYSVYWDGSAWTLNERAYPAQWASSSNVATPNLATGWAAGGGAAGTISLIVKSAGTIAPGSIPPSVRASGSYLYVKTCFGWGRLPIELV